MTPLPPSGPLATGGASLASTIMVIDVSLLVAVALLLGVLGAAFSVGALAARRRRGRARAGSPARAPRVAVPYAALEEGR